MNLSAVSLRLIGAAALLSAAPLAAADPVLAPADASASNESGGSPQAGGAAAAATPKAKEEKKICRFDTASGSHLRGKKICLTSKQWRDRNAD
jgi:hypothetical protein